MDRPFNDVREKRVVTSDGQNVGRVREVNNGPVTIGRSDDDEPTDEIKELLGRSAGDETHDLRQDQVTRYDDNEFHLQPRR